ncbi:hypothetical protein CKO_01686 [Citrobacter koseri ATCC BAA-895]|uniref:Uncharacterized protein n=1 Tax=Citrobacter koseri (strain ATCC BAA-895 / CDC 4225-83 / SGSC4696) TaxID=290338 RepID=A8AH54_CITK8|nr:hypothetical protein CKO_01686 [Citrobacter koseri ATCC BAA-895]
MISTIWSLTGWRKRKSVTLNVWKTQIKKPRRLLRMMTAAMPAKYNDRTGVMPVFFIQD